MVNLFYLILHLASTSTLTVADDSSFENQFVSNHFSPLVILNQIQLATDTTNCIDCDESDLTTTSLPTTKFNAQQKRWTKNNTKS